MDFTYPKYKFVPRFYNILHKPIRGHSCALMNTLFDCGGQITIGKNVFFGSDCMVLTTIHDYNQRGIARKRTYIYKPVTLKDGCWIASGVIIMPGVTIGKHAVIGAGSVVTHDVPDNEVWFGNPAKFHKKIHSE